jgi:ZIP family zinc transporter
MILFIGILATLFTFLGGMFAVYLKDKLHLVLGFSGGAVIGVVFFDLLPEALEIGGKYFSVSLITTIMSIGFLSYMMFDRMAMVSHHGEDEKDRQLHGGHSHGRGRLGAGSLSFHSFLDGLAIGLAFQVSMEVGAIITIAVLVHDFSDGINTVNLILKSGGSKIEAIKWLFLDAIAPLVGIASTLVFTFSEKVLGILLAVFSGFFLYIGASELVPESYHAHPARFTTFMTILGVLVMYTAIRVIGG